MSGKAIISKAGQFLEYIGSLGHKETDDDELKSLKTIVTIAAYIIVINQIYFCYLYFQMGRQLVAISLGLFAAHFVINLILFRFHRNFKIIRAATFFGIFFYIITYHVLMGGFIASSGYIDYGIAVLVGIHVFYRKGQKLAWYFAFVLTAIVLYIFDPLISKNTVLLPDSFRTLAFFNDFLLMSTLIFFSIRFFTIRIREEKARSDRLIHSILPRYIVKELNVKGASEPIMVEQATIFFMDFVGFTQTTAGMDAQELVSELNSYFSAFDQVLNENNVEKLKTIGDGYMGVGGLPERNNSHAVDVGCSALQILNYLTEKNREPGKGWSVRIGLHVGPMVAGIIGKSKFSYDVWGDTVNLGSRLEASSESGCINVSQEFVNLTSDFFEFEARGEIEIKHKIPVTMYFLTGLKKHLSVDGHLRNEAFHQLYKVYQSEPNL